MFYGTVSNAVWTAGYDLRAAEERKFEQYSLQFANIGVQFIQMAFETFGGLSELVRKTLKRITLFNDSRRLNPACFLLVFSRLAQSVCHTNARKRYKAGSKKCRSVSQ